MESRTIADFYDPAKSSEDGQDFSHAVANDVTAYALDTWCGPSVGQAIEALVTGRPSSPDKAPTPDQLAATWRKFLNS